MSIDHPAVLGRSEAETETLFNRGASATEHSGAPVIPEKAATGDICQGFDPQSHETQQKFDDLAKEARRAENASASIVMRLGIKAYQLTDELAYSGYALHNAYVSAAVIDTLRAYGGLAHRAIAYFLRRRLSNQLHSDTLKDQSILDDLRNAVDEAPRKQSVRRAALRQAHRSCDTDSARTDFTPPIDWIEQIDRLGGLGALADL